MKKNISKIICFIMIMLILSGVYYRSFNFKYNDGIYGLQEFYKEKSNSIDVIFFGSSHMFVNINPNVLWREYGIASFDLGGSVQPLWNTYYYLKEAFKTQNPSLVVVDCFGAVGCTDEYIDHSRIIKNNFGLKLSSDKIESIKVSSSREMWADYMLEYPTFHSRYTDITKSDFQSGKAVDYIDYNCWKGMFPFYNRTEQIRPNVEIMSGKADLTDKNEKYLRKIIELAHKHNVPIVLIVAPYVLNNEEMKIYNRISEIANEYDIDYINFNYYYDKIGLNFSTDYGDKGHMNYLGNEKFSKYLGEYLKSEHDIPDRRNNENYISYDEMLSYYEQLIYDKQLMEKNDLESYLEELQNNNYIVVISAIGNYRNISNYNDIRRMLLNCGIDLNKESGNGVWTVKSGKILSASQDADGYCWHDGIGKYDVLTVSLTDAIVEIKLNSANYRQTAEGIGVWIYDTLTESFVGCIGFEAK